MKVEILIVRNRDFTMLIIGIILGAAVVVFMIQNLASVSISFLAWQFDGSLALIVILAILLGMVISWLLSIPDMFRISNLRSHNRRLEQDLEAHKQKLSETQQKLVQAQQTVTEEKTIVIEERL